MHFRDFGEFYTFYLTQHARPWTRRLHALGTIAALTVAATFVLRGDFWLAVPGALITGYAFAWLSHWLIEKNKPATFGHPFWSFLSDFRMLGDTLRKLGRSR